MCGIVGYIGLQQAESILITGLQRLEYRGYDSAGVAIVGDGRLKVRKKEGKVGDLEASINGPRRHAGHRAHALGHARLS